MIIMHCVTSHVILIDYKPDDHKYSHIATSQVMLVSEYVHISYD